MSELKDVSVLAGLLTAVLLISGSAITLIGALGLLRFQTFYERVHAPTLGTTLGAACVAIASLIYFSSMTGRLSVHELLIFFFITLTTPVGLILLVRAASLRDGAKNERTASAGVNKDGR